MELKKKMEEETRKLLGESAQENPGSFWVSRELTGKLELSELLQQHAEALERIPVLAETLMGQENLLEDAWQFFTVRELLNRGMEENLFCYLDAQMGIVRSRYPYCL